ncbi:MAG: amidohydrolase family protein [bacterium]
MKQNKILIIPKAVVTANSTDEILHKTAVEIEDGVIINIAPANRYDLSRFIGEIFQCENLTLIPGFIQTHVHLCQTLFRGMADDLLLLDWLKKRIFPYENAHDENSLRLSAQLGLYELQNGGTTTILDMGSLRHGGVIFDELKKSGMRAFAGKCLIDENDLYSNFSEPTEVGLKSAYDLARQYHNSNGGRIKYGFAPRFVLSCSEKLLKESYRMLDDFPGSVFHSHSSENKTEVEAVRMKSGMENLEYFDSLGLLGTRTYLAHCIHVNEKEIALLKESGTNVLHCPSANLKLGSGVAPIPRFLNEGISVSLGADGPPCNNNLSIFNEMRLAALIQKVQHGPTSMDAKTVFKLSNIKAAQALHIDDEVGSIEVGKKADLVLLNLEDALQPLLDNYDNIYSKIVYSSTASVVRDVMIEGEWVVRDSHSLIFDNEKIARKGKEELIKLLERS